MAFLRKANGLIPRFNLPMAKRTITKAVVDADNPFANATTAYVFDKQLAERCSVQQTTAEQIEALPAGVNTDNLYTIYTDTPMFGAIPNTDLLSDAIYLPASIVVSDSAHESFGGWFLVEQAYHRNSGLINHTELIVSKDLNLLDNEGRDQYPDISTISAGITTKSAVVAGNWESTWLA